MTSPAPDVWPSILTDYTYDSELDNADGVPHSVYDAARVPGGEHSVMKHGLEESSEERWLTAAHYFDKLSSVALWGVWAPAAGDVFQVEAGLECCKLRGEEHG